MKHRPISLALILTLCFYLTPGFAMLPVIDPGAIVKMAEQIQQLEKQYTLLNNTYQNAQAQLNKVKELASDAEGHYGYGGLMNGANDLAQRQWSPDDWKSALKGLSGGNEARQPPYIIRKRI